MKKKIRLISVLTALVMLTVIGATSGSIGDAIDITEGPINYTITCVNCIAQDEMYREITEAAEGDTVNLAFAVDDIPTDKYWSSDSGYVSDEVSITKGEYDHYSFTMVAKDVKVSAKLLDRETGIVDLTEKDSVEGNFAMLDSVVETNQTEAFNAADGIGDFSFDLNKDGKNDITITLDQSNNKATVKRESGSDVITAPVTLTIQDEWYYYRKYKACTFKVTRGSNSDSESGSGSGSGGGSDSGQQDDQPHTDEQPPQEQQPHTEDPPEQQEQQSDEKIVFKKLKKVKVKAVSKKKLKVSWKKLSKKVRKEVRQIQIQVSTDPGFQNIVKTKLVNSKKKSCTISGLKKKTKYYIRVRAYTETEDGIKYVSEWVIKSKKTKK